MYRALKGADLQSVTDRVAIGGNWRTVFDWRSGAFQQNDPFLGEGERRDIMSTAVVYACIRLIAWDIAKLPATIKKLVNDVWVLADHQVLSLLIRKPNYYQGWIDFILAWLFSYLVAGNAYIVKVRGGPGRFTQLVVLDPCKVEVLVDQNSGAIFYRVGMDPLTPVTMEDTLIPASEIIHHRYMAFGHPLIGTSLLVRAQIASRMRQGILTTQADLGDSNAVPAGILIAPEGLSDEQLKTLETRWNNGTDKRVRVVDAAFKFEAMQAKFIDSQSKEFAEVGAVDICVACGVPPWKVGVGTRPVGMDVEAANITYFQDCLQLPIEHIEQLLDTGLEVPKDVYICLERDELFLLDSATRAAIDAILVKGIAAPNELRRKWNLPPTPGGDVVYMQQQNYSLEALAKRDQAAPAPSSTAPSPGGSGGQGPADNGTQPGAEPPAARGRVSLPWAGVWDASGEYSAGCFVTHKGSLWARVGMEVVQGFEPGASTDHEPPCWQLSAKGGRGSVLPGVEA